MRWVHAAPTSIFAASSGTKETLCVGALGWLEPVSLWMLNFPLKLIVLTVPISSERISVLLAERNVPIFVILLAFLLG